jgi:outer membrane protein assembly factor BamA
MFFISSVCFTQSYDGYVIDNINIKTNRMNPNVVRRKFNLKQGDIFTEKSYDQAQDELHNMRLFKEITFNAIPKEDNKIDLDIDAKDGYFFFPLFFASGGDSSGVSLALIEGNYFKQGEAVFLFGGFSKDSVNSSIGLALNDNVYNFKFSKLDFDQKFYDGGWSSNYSIFSSAEDDEYNNPLWKTDTKIVHYSLTFTRKIDLISLFISPIIERVSYDDNLDNGSHNKLSVGLDISDNMPQGANMGAVFGYGLSDKEKALRDLPQMKYGYRFGFSYTGGGNWTGADYEINKFTTETAFIVELKKRHIFLISLKAAQSINSALSESVRSVELFSGAGTYNRQKLGSRGIGLSASFTYYLLRNNLGLFAVEPFYQLAYVHQNGGYADHSGAGASAFYKFWRFPFPVGVNYTRNLSDGSNKVSAFFGAAL